MAEYVSGEEYQAVKSKKAVSPHSRRWLSNHLMNWLVILVVVAGLSFFAGTAYQKSKQPKAASTSSNSSDSNGRSFGGGMGGEGTDNGSGASGNQLY